jgi:REP element-mobilizing transposase RayT
MNASSQGCGQPISVSRNTLSIGQPEHLYHHTIFQADWQSVYLALNKLWGGNFWSSGYYVATVKQIKSIKSYILIFAIWQ